MRFMNAKEFAKVYGYPLRRIRRLCRQKLIPNERCKTGYIFEDEVALAVIRSMQERKVIADVSFEDGIARLRQKNRAAFNAGRSGLAARQ